MQNPFKGYLKNTTPFIGIAPYSTKAPISSRINIRKFIYFTQEKASKNGIHYLLINSSSLLKCSRGVPSRKSRTENQLV